jgi:hypothetical protein
MNVSAAINDRIAHRLSETRQNGKRPANDLALCVKVICTYISNTAKISLRRRKVFCAGRIRFEFGLPRTTPVLLLRQAGFPGPARSGRGSVVALFLGTVVLLIALVEQGH